MSNRDEDGLSSSRNARTWILLVAVAVAVTGSLAFLGGRFTSPEQRAASARPPEPSVLTVSVEKRILKEAVVGRGRAVRMAGRTVNLPTVQYDGKKPIVTDVFIEAGSVLANGSLVAVIADEPLFVFDAGFGPYRDLHRNDRGRDVEELQEALNALGETLATDGVLGLHTENAMHRYLRDRGFLDRLDALNEALQDAPPPVGGSETGRPEDSIATEKPPDLVFPSAWWFASPGLPARVAEVDLRIGDNLATGTSTLTLEGSDTLVDVHMSEGSVGVISEGMPVKIRYDGAETEIALSVANLLPARDASGEREAGRVLFEPSDTSHLREDEPFKIEFILIETEPVMAVPTRAVRSGADGNPIVAIYEQGAIREISVVVGRQADGWVEITPVSEGSLTLGDRVVVR